MHKFSLILAIHLSLILSCSNNNPPKESTSTSTIISFGSCSRQNMDNQRWDDIIKHDPELWIWMGDNIYGDSHDMDIMKEKYDMQKSRPGYKRLMQSDISIIGTWDDHDYGINDGGKQYAKKEESKQLLLDFLDVKKGNPVYDHEGVYQSYEYNYDDHLVKVILLDARNFRDTIYWDKENRAYIQNKTGDVLGETQWSWLESELSNSTAEINIIGSSIQVIPEEHGYEKWSNFPSARKRLFALLQKFPNKKTMFISGDRHIAEISKIDLEGLAYSLYDFTSSGLTHTWGNGGTEPNKYRVSKFTIGLNFGIIKVDWNDEGQNQITFRVIGEENKILDEFKYKL